MKPKLLSLSYEKRRIQCYRYIVRLLGFCFFRETPQKRTPNSLFSGYTGQDSAPSHSMGRDGMWHRSHGLPCSHPLRACCLFPFSREQLIATHGPERIPLGPRFQSSRFSQTSRTLKNPSRMPNATLPFHCADQVGVGRAGPKKKAREDLLAQALRVFRVRGS